MSEQGHCGAGSISIWKAAMSRANCDEQMPDSLCLDLASPYTGFRSPLSVSGAGCDSAAHFHWAFHPKPCTTACGARSRHWLRGRYVDGHLAMSVAFDCVELDFCASVISSRATILHSSGCSLGLLDWRPLHLPSGAQTVLSQSKLERQADSCHDRCVASQLGRRSSS